MSKEAYYFSHDSNSRNDDKILSLRMKYGWDGYGIFWALIEKLRDSKDFMCVKDYNIIAFDLHIDSEKVKSIIEDFGLFSFTDCGNYIYSSSLMRRMEKMTDKRKSASVSGIKGNLIKYDHLSREQANSMSDNEIVEFNNNLKNKSVGVLSGSDGVCIGELSGGTRYKGKEMKGNESKEKESKDLLKKETKYTSLNFKNDLLDFGFKESLVDEWLQVRRNKKSTNSKTALSRFINQVKLHGGDKNEILEECVSKSWTSFNSTWNIDVKKPIDNNYFNNPMNGEVKKPYKPPFAL